MRESADQFPPSLEGQLFRTGDGVSLVVDDPRGEGSWSLTTTVVRYEPPLLYVADAGSFAAYNLHSPGVQSVTLLYRPRVQPSPEEVLAEGMRQRQARNGAGGYAKRERAEGDGRPRRPRN